MPYVVFDTDVEAVREHHRNNGRVFFGDTSRPQLLDRAGAKQARAFLVTVNSASEAERMVQAILRYRPDAFVLARAVARRRTCAAPDEARRDRRGSRNRGGEPDAQRERAFEAMGLPEEAIIRRVKLTRQAEVGALDEPQIDAPAALSLSCAYPPWR